MTNRYQQGEQTFNPDDFKKGNVQPYNIEVRDPIADALNILAANIGALALAIDSYARMKKETISGSESIK